MSEPRPKHRAATSEHSSDSISVRTDFRELGADSGGHDHGHLALLYENQAELFAAAIPFIREGLERGERCLYIADENTKSEALDAMRSGGIDVDAARDAGALSIHGAEEMYLTDGAFDHHEMIESLDEAVRGMTETDEYDTVRITGKMACLGRDEVGVGSDQLAEYEQLLDEFLSAENCIGMCTYNRELFSPAALEDVIQHHPLVVYDSTVTQNFYYVPPEEFADSAGPLQTLERQLQTLLERTQARDALEEREEGLRHLNDASQELMGATEQEINARAAEIVQAVLNVAYTSLWRYDDETGDLELQASSTASGINCETICYLERFEERAWQTFISNEVDVDNDLPPAPDIAPSEEPIRSGVIVPLGRHGVICAGSRRTKTFDETTVDLAGTVATTIETALDRAESEQQLRRQNEELTRLDRINSIIREIDQALVQADTRAEINRVVCERLADSDLYEFAWIGEHDAAANTIAPQEWAGVDSGYVDDLTITTDDTPTGQGPIGTAVRTREMQVVEDIATDARFSPWREQTLAQGVRSCISIPLVYEDALYGVLTVYTGTLDTDEKDRAVLDELGETIAHAINAVETKETLHTDRVVELTLGLQSSASILGRLAEHAGCRIEFEGFVPQSDDSAHVFFTAHDVSPDEIRAAGEDAVAVEELTWITDREDGCLFKARLSGPTLASLVVKQNAMVRTLTFESDGVTAVVDLPSTSTVREFVEAVQTTYSDTELLSRRTRARAIQTPHEFKTAIEDGLTARQQEILRTAYLSGFFQSPRESTGNEIADLLDISQSTFTQHLRAGQHNLFELLFEET